MHPLKRPQINSKVIKTLSISYFFGLRTDAVTNNTERQQAQFPTGHETMPRIQMPAEEGRNELKK